MGNCEKSQAQSWNTKLILSFRDLVIQVSDIGSVDGGINFISSENVLRRARCDVKGRRYHPKEYAVPPRTVRQVASRGFPPPPRPSSGAASFTLQHAMCRCMERVHPEL